MPPVSFRTIINIGCALPSACFAVAVPFAYAAHQPPLAMLAGVAGVCATLGIGVGWALRRLALRVMDRVLSEQKGENLRFDTAINNMSQGLCFFDGDERLIVCNRRYAEMYGLSLDILRPGTTLREIVDLRFEVGSCPAMSREDYLAWRNSIAISDRPSDTATELANGRIFAIHHQPMPGGGWVATHDDITDRRRTEAQIERMARSDVLTGLANRVQFRERLNDLLLQSRATDSVALLLVDLDRFKAVNDTLGHPIGDKLLCAAAQRLRQFVRQNDLVARLGGDEFAIIQTGASQPAAAKSLADRLVHGFAEPFEIGDDQVQVGASVGVALSPDDGVDPDELLKRADLALYDAKSTGRGTLSFFRSEMNERAQGRRALEIDLRQAEARGELELHYQPILALNTNRVTCFEALLRWRHPVRGMVMPDSFIPLAEETGLIESLGVWVLREAFAQATTWPSHVGIAVNLSPVQFKSGKLLGVVAAALTGSGIEPQRVELEITESVRLTEDAANLVTLHELRSLGVRICLDDFGVGYSSLSYLRSFPFKKIKIDRSFIRDVVDNTEAAAIVRAITTLGASLGMLTTAEGVELPEQVQVLRSLGCDEAQGYLFSRPLPASELDTMLQADRGLVGPSAAALALVVEQF
jgi:diguanylate cyclase (GGDEF)-like protein